MRGLGVNQGQSSAGARGWVPSNRVPFPRREARGNPKHLLWLEPRSSPRLGVGEAVHLRVVFTVNYSGEQTHYLGTRIKSHSLCFN